MPRAGARLTAPATNTEDREPNARAAAYTEPGEPGHASGVEFPSQSRLARCAPR